MAFNYRLLGTFLTIIVFTSAIFIFSGCAKQPTKTAVVEQPSDVRQEALMEKKIEAERMAATEQQLASGIKPSPGKPPMVDEKQVAEAPAFVEKKVEADQPSGTKPLKKKLYTRTEYIVKKGESLWWIAKYKDNYNDPFLWPLLYKANKNKIKNPNLIYPGQIIIIPREGYTMEDIKKARKKAGASKPCQPPKGANLPVN